MKNHKIEILLIQEHNIRNVDVICQELKDFCYIIINPAVAHKGGTAIFIDSRISFNIISRKIC